MVRVRMHGVLKGLCSEFSPYCKLRMMYSTIGLGTAFQATYEGVAIYAQGSVQTDGETIVSTTP